MSIGDVVKVWNQVPDELQGVIVELVQGIVSGKPEVKRAHEEAVRRAIFEARQEAKLG